MGRGTEPKRRAGESADRGRRCRLSARDDQQPCVVIGAVAVLEAGGDAIGMFEDAVLIGEPDEVVETSSRRTHEAASGAHSRAISPSVA